jgi:hypothetical protein
MVVTALVALVATDARAQNFDVERGGFFVSANLGFGSGKFSCEQCSADRISGVTMSLALGGGLSNSVIVGGEVDAWWNSRDNTSQWISNVMAYVQVYPAPSSGFFLKGGAGYSHAEAFYPSGTSDAFASVDGFGWVIGGGYDYMDDDDWAITGTLAWMGGLYSSEGATSRPRSNVIQAMIGVTFF